MGVAECQALKSKCRVFQNLCKHLAHLLRIISMALLARACFIYQFVKCCCCCWCCCWLGLDLEKPFEMSPWADRFLLGFRAASLARAQNRSHKYVILISFSVSVFSISRVCVNEPGKDKLQNTHTFHLHSYISSIIIVLGSASREDPAETERSL